MPNSQTARYLKFLARLYEFAADFDQRQLLAIQRVAASENNKLITTVASLLMDLRGDKATRSATRSKRKSISAFSEEGLREVLSSKKIFPSNAALAALARDCINIPQKQKESRERLVNRILREIESSADRDRESFRRALEDLISKQNGGSDFVSRWTKVIQDL